MKKIIKRVFILIFYTISTLSIINAQAGVFKLEKENDKFFLALSASEAQEAISFFQYIERQEYLSKLISERAQDVCDINGGSLLDFTLGSGSDGMSLNKIVDGAIVYEEHQSVVAANEMGVALGAFILTGGASSLAKAGVLAFSREVSNKVIVNEMLSHTLKQLGKVKIKSFGSYNYLYFKDVKCISKQIKNNDEVNSLKSRYFCQKSLLENKLDQNRFEAFCDEAPLYHKPESTGENIIYCKKTKDFEKCFDWSRGHSLAELKFCQLRKLNLNSNRCLNSLPNTYIPKSILNACTPIKGWESRTDCVRRFNGSSQNIVKSCKRYARDEKKLEYCLDNIPENISSHSVKVCNQYTKLSRRLLCLELSQDVEYPQMKKCFNKQSIQKYKKCINGHGK